MQIYIDEKVVIWKRTTMDIPDNIPIEQVVEELKECEDAYSYFDKHDENYSDCVEYGISEPDIEYLFDTEELYNTHHLDNHTTEVYLVQPVQDKCLGIW